ncbi:hypothetical protein OAT44_07680 [Alphaproteobacteria bacterium]|nr:hypothetical protein [Alphaproteobacteria bacterium]
MKEYENHFRIWRDRLYTQQMILILGNIGVEVYLKRIWNRRKKELRKDSQLTEYVFINNLANKPIGSIKGSWNSIMKGNGLLYDKDGNKRVPHSLRHTYVTMRLGEGVNIY